MTTIGSLTARDTRRSGDASDDAPTALMPLMPLQRTIRDVDEASIRISLAKATGPCGGALMRVTELAA